MTMEMRIEASRLKHALSVLRRVGNESVFAIKDGEIASKVTSVGCDMMVEVYVKDNYGDYAHVDEVHSVGVDLNKVWSFVRRADARDEIAIVTDGIKMWNVSRGIHSRSFVLLDVDNVRKCIEKPNDLSHDAIVALTGKEFKSVVAEAGEVNNWVMFQADNDGMIFRAEGFDKGTYVGTLPSDRVSLQRGKEVVRCLYTIENLADIVIGMRAKDDVRLRFSKDLPCEIEYERHGVIVDWVLAPRIESE